MALKPRALALLSSLALAGITTLFLVLVPGTTPTILWSIFFLVLLTGYLLFRLIAEFLFFREIKNIHAILEKLKDNDLESFAATKPSSLNPLRSINKDLYQYAETKQQEIEELKRMETFRREFIADVSHELKTPIFAAQGFVHTLLDGAVEDKKVRNKFLKKAAKSLDGLDILVQDLLTISQMESGEIRMRMEDFDIMELCREIYDQLEPKADKKNIRLGFSDTCPPVAYVQADFHRIYQVMINLVSNAIKYTKKNGSVLLNISDTGDHIRVEVKDTGRGIPAADIHRIFERFYRVEKSRSKEKGGSGLGLSIVKHILENHQSQIEVQSKVGVGSVFWFNLGKGNPAPRISWEDDDE
ncbi:MAG: ATP-binding protein [Cyclobacteriaceae bacterium]|nr:ATP-binding protein [Cyclobacteriaceae bacterium]